MFNILAEVSRKLEEHLRRQALGDPIDGGRTVVETVNQITRNQGGMVEGALPHAYEKVANDLVSLKATSLSGPQQICSLNTAVSLQAEVMCSDRAIDGDDSAHLATKLALCEDALRKIQMEMSALEARYIEELKRKEAELKCKDEELMTLRTQSGVLKKKTQRRI